jgi:hypothetical protein
MATRLTANTVAHPPRKCAATSPRLRGEVTSECTLHISPYEIPRLRIWGLLLTHRPGMTRSLQMSARILAASFARVLPALPPITEGAGKAGRQMHPQPRVRK